MKITAVLNWNLLTVLVLASVPTVAADYDPLAVPKSGEVRSTDLTVRDEARKRDVPLRVYLPAATDPAPVVLFSHGLGGSRENNPYLGKHWAARGYVAGFLQHPGSDDSVWKDTPPAQRMATMARAASAQNLVLRVQDVPSYSINS